MARTTRSDQFDPLEVGVYHCLNRCVRRSFLCGKDPATKKNFEHRRLWIQERIEFLAAYFAIDVFGFAILANHFHIVLRNRPDVVAMWSDTEVARRWLMLCPVRKRTDGSPEEPSEFEIGMIINDKVRIEEIRKRLSDISWFMRMIAERIARRSNAEDEVTGRFWEGRFRMTRLCDLAAALACLMYVDLNAIRAGVALTPETSDYTSAKLRIDQHVRKGSSPRWLSPLQLDEAQSPGPMISNSPYRCSDKGILPIALLDYLQLLDWTGRQLREGHSGRIPAELEPILMRLGIDPKGWFKLATEFGSLFLRVAGSRQTLSRLARAKGRRWYQAPGGDLITAAAA